MSAVLDASFLSRALIPSQRLPEVTLVLRDLVRRMEPVAAPYLLQSEFVSGLRRLERRGVLPAPDTIRCLGQFRSLPIEFAWEPAWVDRGLEIAREVNLSTIYDAVYLACAETYDADLYTCDRQFCSAFGASLPARVKLVPIAP